MDCAMGCAIEGNVVFAVVKKSSGIRLTWVPTLALPSVGCITSGNSVSLNFVINRRLVRTQPCDFE